MARSGLAIARYTVCRDPGRLTQLPFEATHLYRVLNQLCMVQYPNGNQVTYAYDANGNRTAKSEGGNILQSYAYDFENHMVQASGPGGILGTYYYNADGLRVAKTTAAGTVGFIYDDMKLLQEVGATGQTTATYTSTGGRPESRLLGVANSAGSHVPLVDALGSVRFLLDSSQNASDGYVYEAFGRQVSGGGLTPNPYHFVGAYGYYQDWETGLQLLTARYYDAEVGRFVTRDPIGFGGGDWNVYGYVGNSPADVSDPDGLAKGGKQSPKGNDPRYLWNCDQILAELARLKRTGGDYQTLRTIAKLKKCIGSGGRKGQKHAHRSCPVPVPIPGTEPLPVLVLPKPPFVTTPGNVPLPGTGGNEIGVGLIGGAVVWVGGQLVRCWKETVQIVSEAGPVLEEVLQCVPAP